MPEIVSEQSYSKDLMSAYDTMCEAVEQYLPESKTALRLVLAVAAAGFLRVDPMLWVLIVGPPSSGKTDLVRLVKDLEFTYSLDNLTTNAFVSGERETDKNKVHDLLSHLDGLCLVIKDWTPLFSLDEKATVKILGDLVGIYDKEYAKFSSQRGRVSYSTIFSQLGCITPSTLGSHQRYMNMVGPRFLFYAIPPLPEDVKRESFKNIFSGKSRSEAEKAAQQSVHAYLELLITTPCVKLPIVENGERFLENAAQLLANCRGVIQMQSEKFTNEDGKEITYDDVQDVQIEDPWRAAHQLYKLGQLLAYSNLSEYVGEQELEIVKEVVLSSMPPARAFALRALIKHGGSLTSNDLNSAPEGKSRRTSQRILKMLNTLNVVRKTDSGGNLPLIYEIEDKFREFLLSSVAEFLSHEKPFATTSTHTSVDPTFESISMEVFKEVFPDAELPF